LHFEAIVVEMVLDVVVVVVTVELVEVLLVVVEVFVVEVLVELLVVKLVLLVLVAAWVEKHAVQQTWQRLRKGLAPPSLPQRSQKEFNRPLFNALLYSL